MLRCSVNFFFNFLQRSVNMTNEIFQTFSKTALQAIDNWQKLAETNMQIGEKLFQSQIELTEALLDVVSMNGEEISQSRDFQEIVGLQAEIAQVSGKLVLENAQSVASILADGAKTYGFICETTLKATGSEIKKPANTQAPAQQLPKAAASAA